MQIEKLTDAALHSNIKNLVAREREILTDVLKHLLEVDRRKLFAKFKYPSLFEYARHELGYSEDAAYRRIDAMRALREMPALESKISAGTVTLSAINAAQTVIRAERKVAAVTVERKLELFTAVENKSKREAEKTLHKMTTAPKELIRPEKVREVGEHIEIRFTADQRLQETLARVRAELSHTDPHISIAEIFAKLCAEFLERAEKKKRLKAHDRVRSKLEANPACEKSARAAGAPAPTSAGDCETSAPAPSSVRAVAPACGANPTSSAPAQKSASSPCPAPAQKSISAPAPTPLAPARKSIPASTRRIVFHRAGRKCEKCGSTWRLEVDHRRPIALGGGNELCNLRVLCRNCNQRAAIESLGREKMRIYENPKIFKRISMLITSKP